MIMLSLARKIYKTENKTMRDPLKTFSLLRAWYVYNRLQGPREGHK